MSTANKILQAAAGNAGEDEVFVDDLFSTHLHVGNGGNQIISNGIALGSANSGGSADFASGEYLERSSDFTSNSDSKTFTLSVWVFYEGDSITLYRFGSANNRINLHSNQLEVVLYNTSGSKVIDNNISHSFSNYENSWVHVLLSLDVNSGSGKLYVNDSAVSWTVSISNNSNINFTEGNHRINGPSSGFHYSGACKISSYYLDYTYRDLATTSNRRIFIDSDGYAVSGLESYSPILYLPLSSDYAITKNLGTGGDLSTATGSITTKFGPFNDTSLAKGGLVWIKERNDTGQHHFYDTERGATKRIHSNSTDAEATQSDALTEFNSNGFTLGANTQVNDNGEDTCSWTFRKQKGFFDIVTYTGNGTAGRTISHNLGSVPGMIIVKKTSGTEQWNVYHRGAHASTPENYRLLLDSTSDVGASGGSWNNTAPTATQFTVGSGTGTNESSSTYVAYLFAHVPTTDFNEEVFSATYFADGSSPVSVTGPDGSGEYNFYTNTSTGSTYARIAGTSHSVSGTYAWDALSDLLYGIYGNRYRVGNYKYTNGGVAPHYDVRYYTDYSGSTVDDEESFIVCGTYEGSGFGSTPVELGFEPQWLMIKNTERTDNWTIIDSMRGLTAKGSYKDNYLSANLTTAETTGTSTTEVIATSTGFIIPDSTSSEVGEDKEKYIYVAIRRPMKTPTAATEVFDTNNYVGDDAANRALTSGFVTDLNIFKGEYAGNAPSWFDRLRGNGKKLQSNSNDAESDRTICSFDVQDGIYMPNAYGENNYNHPSYTNNYGYINYQFRRATGFMDIVAWEGDGDTSRTLNHNLGVTPELIFTKRRSSAYSWFVYSSVTGQARLSLDNNSAAAADTSIWNNTNPTSEVFSVSNFRVNRAGDTLVAYLFATLDGISKVGSYTGTGSDINVDCGFSAGARFVMVKRTDSTGNWYFWDTDRGIVAGNDSYMIFNDTDGETTTVDYIDPLSSGFTITSSAPAELNTSGGTYLFLAIA